MDIRSNLEQKLVTKKIFFFLNNNGNKNKSIMYEDLICFIFNSFVWRRTSRSSRSVCSYVWPLIIFLVNQSRPINQDTTNVEDDKNVNSKQTQKILSYKNSLDQVLTEANAILCYFNQYCQAQGGIQKRFLC